MKKLFLSLALIMICLLPVGCNKMFFDTTYTFNKAIIELPNGDIISGKIEAWTDFEDGDQIQVKMNGKTYLVHSSNIVLIAD